MKCDLLENLVKLRRRSPCGERGLKWNKWGICWA